MRSLIAVPISRAIHTTGMPSAVQRSLASNDSRNSQSLWLFTKKLRLGVERTKGTPLAAAISRRCKTSGISIASIGTPRMQKTSLERSSGTPVMVFGLDLRVTS